VVVTGGAGFLGKPTTALLGELGAEVSVIRSAEYDLREREAAFSALQGAEVVLHLAANVGGIGFNRRNPAPLARDNLAMSLNVFEAARELEIGKLVAAGSVCAYPKFTPVPFSEDEIWNGYPEESNAPYGLAKKMNFVLSDAYRRQYGLDSCVPVMANLYGPGDNFDLEDSHVIAAMVHKYAVATERGEAEVVLWGTGEPSREFLYVDDAARALLLCAERLRGEDRLGRLQARWPAEAVSRCQPGRAADRIRGRDAARGGAAADDRVLPVHRHAGRRSLTLRWRPRSNGWGGRRPFDESWPGSMRLPALACSPTDPFC
jgi:GDP-L-fucose synthase